MTAKNENLIIKRVLKYWNSLSTWEKKWVSCCIIIAVTMVTLVLIGVAISFATGDDVFRLYINKAL